MAIALVKPKKNRVGKPSKRAVVFRVTTSAHNVKVALWISGRTLKLRNRQGVLAANTRLPVRKQAYDLVMIFKGPAGTKCEVEGRTIFGPIVKAKRTIPRSRKYADLVEFCVKK